MARVNASNSKGPTMASCLGYPTALIFVWDVNLPSIEEEICIFRVLGFGVSGLGLKIAPFWGGKAPSG